KDTLTFSGNANLANGTNNVPVSITDGTNGTKTNNYQVSTIGSASATPTFDLNGNMTSDGTNSYVFDAEDRLIQITYPGTGNNSQFVFDAYGLFTKIVEVSGGTNTSIKQFVWSNIDQSEERNSGGVLTRQFFSSDKTISGISYFFH
ncbi:MAG: hypothetical protein IPO31_27700, partial [Candidatus Obscuribacter sp.]|nr:hypothetical protein [Candidatus Obscuribacter sp.]